MSKHWYLSPFTVIIDSETWAPRQRGDEWSAHKFQAVAHQHDCQCSDCHTYSEEFYDKNQ